MRKQALYAIALSVLLPLTAHAAGEIQALEPALTGQTLYFVLFSGPGEADAGEAWDGDSWEPFTTTRATWDIAMSEVSSTGQFLGTMPAISRKIIRWQVYQDADDDGTPSHTDDILLYEGSGEWSGSRFFTAADVTHWNATAIPGVDTAGYPKVTHKEGTGDGELLSTNGLVSITETDIELDDDALDAIGERARDKTLAAVLSGYTTSGTVGEAVNWLKAAFTSSGVFSEPALVNAGSGGGGGDGQPRVNFPPSPGFTLNISRRADGTYKAGPLPIRLDPGTVTDIAVFIDMTPLFGKNNFVETVGTPTVSGGSITATALGPRDTYAVIELDGTATAGEERTVSANVTMTTGEVVRVVFDVEVFDD